MKTFLFKIIILLMLTFIWIFSILPNDWYSYIGKNVKIEAFGDYQYIGKVEDIVEVEECIEKDGFNDCVFSRTRYTMFLKIEKGIVILRCEDIIEIKEI